MKAKILKTEHEYNEACDRIYKLIKSSEFMIEPNSAEGDEMELLSLLVEKNEQEHLQLEAPEPIKFRMEQMNLKLADIAPLFGGKTRVSELLNCKRTLTLKMITLLNRYLGIPLESLVSGNKEIKLEAENRDNLLKISSIKDYLNGTRVVMI